MPMDGPTRVRVFLTPPAMVELESASVLADESRTDAMNRAIQLYALYVRTVKDGGTFLVRDANGRTAELLDWT